MPEQITVFEKQIAVNVKVAVVDVTIRIGATEVIIMPAAVMVGGGQVSAWVPRDADFIPLNGVSYDVDSRPAPVGVLLPQNPIDNYTFYVRDGYGFFATNGLTLIPFVGSGHKIVQTTAVEEPLTINYPHQGTGFLIRFRASDLTWSW